MRDRLCTTVDVGFGGAARFGFVQIRLGHTPSFLIDFLNLCCFHFFHHRGSSACRGFVLILHLEPFFIVWQQSHCPTLQNHSHIIHLPAPDTSTICQFYKHKRSQCHALPHPADLDPCPCLLSRIMPLLEKTAALAAGLERGSEIPGIETETDDMQLRPRAKPVVPIGFSAIIRSARLWVRGVWARSSWLRII